SALADAAAVVAELDSDLVRTVRQRLLSFDVIVVQAVEVVAILRATVLHVQAPSADAATDGDDHAFGSLVGHHNLRGDGVALVLVVDDGVLGQATHASEEQLTIPANQLGAAGDVRIG